MDPAALGAVQTAQKTISAPKSSVRQSRLLIPGETGHIMMEKHARGFTARGVPLTKRRAAPDHVLGELPQAIPGSVKQTLTWVRWFLTKLYPIGARA